jgi:hypothetical protein
VQEMCSASAAVSKSCTLRLMMSGCDFQFLEEVEADLSIEFNCCLPM